MKNYVVSTVDELRKALAEKGPRKITFGDFRNESVCELGAVLYVTDHKDLVLENGDATLDGGISPVTIYGARFIVKGAKNVVIKNLHFRLGATGWRSKGKKTSGNDRVERESLLIERAKNILISHCSISWGTDETLSIVDSLSVTVEWTIISEPLNCPRDTKGMLLHSDNCPHGYGCLIYGSSDILVHHCLMAHCLRRSPSISPDGKYPGRVQIGNCLIYDYREHGSCFNDGNHNNKECVIYNLINNCYRPLRKDHGPDISIETPSKNALLLYTIGNVRDTGHGSYVAADIVIDDKNNGRVINDVENLLDLGYNDWQPAEVAAEQILQKAGAPRDLIDERIVSQVAKRSGTLIDHEKDVPEYKYFSKS